jgi:hypothetical protein
MYAMNREGHVCRRLLAVGGIVGGIIMGTAGCGASQDEKSAIGTEYSVDVFTYNPIKNVGKIAATAVIRGHATDRQAEESMQAFLASADEELGVYFPDVPAAVRDGNFVCGVVKHSKVNHTYRFDCTATPLGSSSQEAV